MNQKKSDSCSIDVTIFEDAHLSCRKNPFFSTLLFFYFLNEKLNYYSEYYLQLCICLSPLL